MMNRIHVLQEIVKKIGAKTYLEIGVAQGSVLYKIRCIRKYAVDPGMEIRMKFKHIIRNPYNLLNQYFYMTSDAFFHEKQGLLQSHGLDLVFIDGLHTFEQSLKDVMNALRYLNEGGVIVMHDCSPPYEAAAYPAPSFEEAVAASPPGWTGAWNGDVWKTIVYIRSCAKDLDAFVLDFDDGVGIVTKGKPKTCLSFSEQDISRLSYHDLEQSREEFLNLKSAEFFTQTFLPAL